ncbi:hypothetical protein BpHYR1_032954 [Brachionus plicatilis]|uniref:Uncharacterized protein n=1 Tax=Brachionus plicatilis TaxID=10195 RepID=A0A3M7QTC5_BRAPC|nr:hypothetical protein BpHYR1_032954 [Brachionus plicatilis]
MIIFQVMFCSVGIDDFSKNLRGCDRRQSKNEIYVRRIAGSKTSPETTALELFDFLSEIINSFAISSDLGDIDHIIIPPKTNGRLFEVNNKSTSFEQQKENRLLFNRNVYRHRNIIKRCFNSKLFDQPKTKRVKTVVDDENVENKGRQPEEEKQTPLWNC